MTQVRSNYPRIKKEKKKAKSRASCSCTLGCDWVMKHVRLGTMKGENGEERRESERGDEPYRYKEETRFHSLPCCLLSVFSYWMSY